MTETKQFFSQLNKNKRFGKFGMHHIIHDQLTDSNPLLSFLSGHVRLLQAENIALAIVYIKYCKYKDFLAHKPTEFKLNRNSV